MDAASAVERRLTPEAVEFVRYCYARRRLGWPELYDEMCAVASRGLFHGWGPDDLAQHGVGFGLFELPALAAVVARVVAEEQATEREHGRRGARPVPCVMTQEAGAGVTAVHGPATLTDERRARDGGPDEAPAGPMLRPMLVPLAS